MLVNRPKKRVTMEDIAREAGVSTMTVSRVLNNKGETSADTRERIYRIANELDYRPSRIARSLATQQSYTLGLIVPDIANPYFAELASGAEKIAWEQGYNVLLCNTQENAEREQDVLRLLEETQVDGVLLCATRLPDDVLLPLLEKHRAVVLLNREIDSEAVGMVNVQDDYGAQIAVQHLIQRGRQQIGFLAGPPNSQSARLRARGFLRAHAAAQRPTHNLPQLDCAPDSRGGHTAARRLLEQHPALDALFCYNDLVAVGALQACREMGKRVPQDIAIVGCDDIPLASLVWPPLTSVRADVHHLGELALHMLIKCVQGKQPQPQIRIKPQLVIRESAP